MLTSLNGFNIDDRPISIPLNAFAEDNNASWRMIEWQKLHNRIQGLGGIVYVGEDKSRLVGVCCYQPRWRRFQVARVTSIWPVHAGRALNPVWNLLNCERILDRFWISQAVISLCETKDRK